MSVNYFDYDELAALWEGRLPMERVLKTLRGEIENRKTLETNLAAALARAETAESQRDDLRALVQGENGLNARALKIMQLKMEVRRLENENDELRARVEELEAQATE